MKNVSWQFETSLNTFILFIEFQPVEKVATKLYLKMKKFWLLNVYVLFI